MFFPLQWRAEYAHIYIYIHIYVNCKTIYVCPPTAYISIYLCAVLFKLEFHVLFSEAATEHCTSGDLETSHLGVGRGKEHAWCVDMSQGHFNNAHPRLRTESEAIYVYLCLYMYIYVYLSIYLSMYLSIFLSIYLSIFLSLFIYFFIYLFIYFFLSFYLSILLSFHLSIFLSFYLSIFLSSYLPIFLSIYIHTCIYIYIYICS